MCDPFSVPAISSPNAEMKNNHFQPELKSSVLITECKCGRRNGLQMECRLSTCQGKRNRAQNNNGLDMNPVTNNMTNNCTHQGTYQNKPNPACPEIVSAPMHSCEGSPHVTPDMPPESALRPDEMADVVYIDYGQNTFPDNGMQQQQQQQQPGMQYKMSPQMMNQYQMQQEMHQKMPIEMQQEKGSDQKGQQIAVSTAMMSPQTQNYYPPQMSMPQMMPMAAGQAFTMPTGYNMPVMPQMPPTSYYPMMQGQAPMMQTSVMPQPMNMQNCTEMQNSSQN